MTGIFERAVLSIMVLISVFLVVALLLALLARVVVVVVAGGRQAKRKFCVLEVMLELNTVRFELVASNADVEGRPCGMPLHRCAVSREGKWQVDSWPSTHLARESRVPCSPNPKLSLIHFFHLLNLLHTMDDRPHKAHRAPQSGGKINKKGKEKQHGFNEKVCRRNIFRVFKFHAI